MIKKSNGHLWGKRPQAFETQKCASNEGNVAHSHISKAHRRSIGKFRTGMRRMNDMYRDEVFI